ncbi:MAG: heme o synthase [Candidatus Obscuribacterales bacterium]|nr:heme o synthase [Candidatus Obscuribacterales bacterium]
MSKNKRAANIISAYIDLMRMRILVLVMVSCALGYILSYHDNFHIARFVWTLIGTGLLSGGSCALNCYLERDFDALMPRTSERPIPAGIISPRKALAFGIVLLVAGSLLLLQCNILTASLGLTAPLVYLALYTPAKRLTWLNTSIGAIPGALPPLIGWASARNEVTLGAWILFAMLFLWQHTHFFPIAWLYKDDYQKGGFKMLPVLELDGRKTFLLTVLSAVALLPVSMLLCGIGLTGTAYCVGAAVSGLVLIAAGFKLAQQPSRQAARNVLLLSVIYLPIITLAVILDRYGSGVGHNLLSWLETVWRWT